MSDYDRLPAVVRQALREASVKFSATQTLDLVRWGGVPWALEQITHNEKLNHDGGVRLGVVPRITGNFQVNPIRPPRRGRRYR